MEQSTPATSHAGYPDGSGRYEVHSSGVCWSAVTAGAFATGAMALILLALGAGLNLSWVSPWSGVGASASTIGKTAIIWLIVMEVLSSAMGGYIAGRLRKRWPSIHGDEVHFRDTAHGLLAWSVALVVTIAFLTSATTSLLGTNQKREPSAHAESQASGPNAYFVDALFRADTSRPEMANASVRNEAEFIFAKGLHQGALSSDDKTYLDQLVAAKTGMNPGDADNRVSNVFANAQQTAENIRKAAAHSLLWIFLALLIGVFCASLFATIGGRQRDRVELI